MPNTLSSSQNNPRAVAPELILSVNKSESAGSTEDLIPPKQNKTNYGKKHSEIANFDLMIEHDPTKINDTPGKRLKSGKKPRKNKIVVDNNQDKSEKEISYANASNVKEIPPNAFDFIWDTSNILPTLGHQIERNKTLLGARVAKSDDKEPSSSQTEANSNGIDRSKSLLGARLAKEDKSMANKTTTNNQNNNSFNEANSGSNAGSTNQPVQLTSGSLTRTRKAFM